jgi:hypothetical protein
MLLTQLDQQPHDPRRMNMTTETRTRRSFLRTVGMAATAAALGSVRTSDAGTARKSTVAVHNHLKPTQGSAIVTIVGPNVNETVCLRPGKKLKKAFLVGDKHLHVFVIARWNGQEATKMLEVYGDSSFKLSTILEGKRLVLGGARENDSCVTI